VLLHRDVEHDARHFGAVLQTRARRLRGKCPGRLSWKLEWLVVLVSRQQGGKPVRIVHGVIVLRAWGVRNECDE
jgi:hypothetical protein